MKLYEMVSAKKGSSFKLNGVTLQLDRFSLEQAYELEKIGYSLDKLEEVMKNKPVEAVTEVCYSLLNESSKDQVGGSVSSFRKCLEVVDIEALMKAMVETISEGQPVPKK